MAAKRLLATSTSKQARFFHSTSSCCVKYNSPGQGGASEERHIAKAIQSIRDSPPRVVLEVMNASHVDIASRYLPARRMLKENAQIWVRLLTHADCLSREALAYQMQRAGRHDERDDRSTVLPVIAMDLKDAAKLKGKQVKKIMNIIVGAQTSILGTGPMMVCGLPNAGKSSLIHCLTKARTLEVKKKKSYHLPKINATAGWTLGIKNHAFELKGQTYSLTDTPGLRPRLDHLEDIDMAYLLATGSTKISKDILGTNNELKQKIVEILWKGLKRHADLSLSETIPFNSFDELWTSHCLKFDLKDSTLIQHLIPYCLKGGYGGLVIEKGPIADAEKQGDASLTFFPQSTIVAMNHTAKLL